MVLFGVIYLLYISFVLSSPATNTRSHSTRQRQIQRLFLWCKGEREHTQNGAPRSARDFLLSVLRPVIPGGMRPGDYLIVSSDGDLAPRLLYRILTIFVYSA